MKKCRFKLRLNRNHTVQKGIGEEWSIEESFSTNHPLQQELSTGDDKATSSNFHLQGSQHVQGHKIILGDWRI